MTLPEVLLWAQLRGARQHGLRFRRQHPVGPFVLDFYCPEARLCVEVDGRAHDSLEVAARDLRRDRWLTQHGIRVLRIAASDMLADDGLDAALKLIVATAREQ
jgi:very-short-patch-repair endonuclease